MAVIKKVPPKKVKPATIQLVDPELKAKLDRVAAFVGEDAPALLRRIIRRGLLVEDAIGKGPDHKDARQLATKIRYDHAHMNAYIEDVLGKTAQQQPATKPSPTSGEITFDSNGFGDSQDV